MNEVSEILIPLKAFVIKIFKTSLNVRTLSERSIKNSDTFEGICNQNIQNIAKCADHERTKWA